MLALGVAVGNVDAVAPVGTKEAAKAEVTWLQIACLNATLQGDSKVVTTALHPRRFAAANTNIENGDANASSPRPVENSKSPATSIQLAINSAFCSGRISSVASISIVPILLQIFPSSLARIDTPQSCGNSVLSVCWTTLHKSARGIIVAACAWTAKRNKRKTVNSPSRLGI